MSSPTSASAYPSDWPFISHRAKVRAGWRCEECGVGHLAWGWRDGAGRFNEVPRDAFQAAGYAPPFDLLCWDQVTRRIIEVVLALAHLDHDTANCEPANLRVMCQACHLSYDRAHHLASSAARRREEMATQDLFGP